MEDLKMSKEEMIEEIKKMTVVELADLVKAIEEEFGVSAVAAAAPAAGAGAAAAAEEKTSFNVVLSSAGDQKIKVIKVVRDATGLGLKEAKELVDGAPKTVKENVSKEEAEDLKAKFTEVGATVELQ
jgi:large subunit ribosomal protein L7/L12